MIDDKTCWPEGFMCIGGKTFQWVYSNRQEFVDFTLHEMDNPSGLFKKWKQYVYSKINNKQDVG